MKGQSGQSVEIELLGQKISLKSTGDPQLVREVVEIVSKKIKKAEERTKSPAPHHVALLALLELGEEFVQAKRRFSSHRAKVEASSQELFKLIEAEMR